MKFDKLQPHSELLIDFFSEGLQSVGGVCERTWYDKLEVVVEGPAAKAWNPNDDVVHRELRFLAVDTESAKSAETDIFPGCPLTFQLAETLWSETPSAFRIVCDAPSGKEKPSAQVLRKTWDHTFGDRGSPEFSPIVATRHFSMVFVVRLEIQSIEQHWALHRIACAWPGAWRDHNLEENLLMLAPQKAVGGEEILWPECSPDEQNKTLRQLLEGIRDDIGPVLGRQQKYLEKELRRIDLYFTRQIAELKSRARPTGAAKSVHTKIDERIDATRAEHARRREDQVQRHEVVVVPHVDAVTCVAEPAWQCNVRLAKNRGPALADGMFVFVPRLRRWFPAL